ncbi:hypothetical protein QE152_g35904 [Popillia japonica]|uniref:Uncharacterized protein n=1 Tax=Popillia japonica TaxID=7064 RepID=A0AAW1IEN0_POPJA
MAENINKPSTLQIRGNPKADCIEWIDGLKIFLIAAGLEQVGDKRKIALLINMIGEDGHSHELIKHFTCADTEEKNKYKIVVKKFQDYCTRVKNIIVERFNFNNAVQKYGETFESFLTELRNKASMCEFGVLHEGLISDRIVCGIKGKALQKRLLQESNLALRDCVEIRIHSGRAK